MKRLLIIFGLFLITYGTLFGQQELWVDGGKGVSGASGSMLNPMKSVNDAIATIPDDSTGIIHVKGIIRDGIKIKNRYFGKLKSNGKREGELLIDGHNETIVYGFDGDFNPNIIPPNYPPRNWKTVSIMDSRNITIRGVESWGGKSSACNLESIQKDPDKWLSNIKFEYSTYKWGTQRTVFSGANTYSNVTFSHCILTDNIYPTKLCTHTVYLSGGHWHNAIGLPPVSNITFKHCDISYAGGRHGLQFNGRFKGIHIINCRLYLNMFAGISLIGCQDVEITGCEIWGNNRQGIVLYSYWDDAYFGDPSVPEDWEEWAGCHHKMKNYYIHNNNIMVGPEAWLHYDGKSAKPYTQPTILINDDMADLADKLGYEGWDTQNIIIENNVLASPWYNIIEYGGIKEFFATKCKGNLVYTYDSNKEPSIKIPYEEVIYPINWMDSNVPDYFKDHIIIDPKFKIYPSYTFVDLDITPNYNFLEHPHEGNLFSKPAERLGKGKKYPAIWIPGKGSMEVQRKYQRAKMKIDPILPPELQKLDG